MFMDRKNVVPVLLTTKKQLDFVKNIEGLQFPSQLCEKLQVQQKKQISQHHLPRLHYQQTAGKQKKTALVFLIVNLWETGCNLITIISLQML